MEVDLKKKKKKKRSTSVWWHLLREFRPRNDSKGARIQLVTFFFSFGGHPLFFSFFINFEAGPLPQRSGLELNLNVPILLKKLMK